MGVVSCAGQLTVSKPAGTRSPAGMQMRRFLHKNHHKKLLAAKKGRTTASGVTFLE
jgi:hypothetical protein